MIDDFMMFAATSDFMAADQVVALGDMLRDPDLQAEHKDHQRQTAQWEVNIMAPIIVALQADLAN